MDNFYGDFPSSRGSLFKLCELNQHAVLKKGFSYRDGVTGTIKLTRCPNRERDLNRYPRSALDASGKRLVQKGMTRPSSLRSNCMYTTIASSQTAVALT